MHDKLKNENSVNEINDKLSDYFNMESFNITLNDENIGSDKEDNSKVEK